MKWLAAVLGVLGLLALVAGILYLALPAHSLPSILGPLYGPHHKPIKAHRKRRGEAAVALGVVLWVIAGIVLYVSSRPAKKTEAVQPEAPQPTS